MNKLKDINLDSNLVKALQKQGINNLNKVQSLVFEDIKNHKDLIVQSQTGSGKTLAYLLPLFEKIDTTKRETQVIVLAPTHELVMQIVSQVKLLSQNSNMNVTTLPLMGEVNIQKQIKNINIDELFDNLLKSYEDIDDKFSSLAKLGLFTIVTTPILYILTLINKPKLFLILIVLEASDFIVLKLIEKDFKFKQKKYK